MAPEIVKRKDYMGKPVDLWSMGVVLYALLCGRFPFSAKTYPELYKKIARGIFHIPDDISLAARDLISNLLVVDPDSRYTLEQAKAHPWLSKAVAANKATTTTTATPSTTPAFLMSANPQDDLDQDLLHRMERFGIPRELVTSWILHRKRNSITTAYYLLRAALAAKDKDDSKAKICHPGLLGSGTAAVIGLAPPAAAVDKSAAVRAVVAS